MKLVVISGVSGSGKSTALHVLEDQDYYCIDNLPVGLLPDFAVKMSAFPGQLGELAAVGIDARNPALDLSRFPEILNTLKATGIDCEVIFLDADDEVLLKRFSETRRKHPLSGDDVPLHDAIHHERLLLQPINDTADLYVDTTQRNVHQLRDLIRERIQGTKESGLSILFESFGFKHGIATDADFVFDVRCLPNPHWETKLRTLTGLDKPVADFLEGQSLVEKYFDTIKSFMTNWIPCFEADNRSYLTVAIGCTGGQHRSVYLSERLGQFFRQQRDHVIIRHRDLS
ncbi:MAG: RNase adapter RapZ [Ectothiorhodospiraceae bacterium]|nr:RNase adapter RapZ [Ectothiorhodospiraceae bacterium]